MANFNKTICERHRAKMHTGNLESEMLKRGMFFDVINWSEDQGTLPFER